MSTEIEIDGDLSAAIQLPDELTGALFGPDISRAYIGTREALEAKGVELKLDQRGVSYNLSRQGESPMWSLVLQLTQGLESDDPSDPGWEANLELPIEIIWRMTDERTEIDYRKVGRFEKMMNNDLSSEERRDFNKLLEELLAGTATTYPSWIADKPPAVSDLIYRIAWRFERGKNTTFMALPVLARDASFRKGANYRSKINDLNRLYTSAVLKTTYPEIPQQIKDRMPNNGEWKVSRNEWDFESGGQGRESLLFVWSEWNDPEDTVDFT